MIGEQLYENADVNSIADSVAKTNIKHQTSNIPSPSRTPLDFQKHRTLGLDHGYRLLLRMADMNS